MKISRREISLWLLFISIGFVETGAGSLTVRLSELNTPEEMVLIPAGWFLMGSNDRENKGGYMTEQPRHRVYLDGYEVDRYEVSNIQYLRFVLKTGHALPAYWDGLTFPRDIANHPVIGVNWFDADIFCKQAGKRLPSEAEWEKAARGEHALNYPWGNRQAGPHWANLGKQSVNPNMEITDFKGKFYPPLADVNDFSAGQSPYGVFQMAGNVTEWVEDWWSADYYKESPDHNPRGPAGGTDKIIRGGSWNDDPLALRTATRTGKNPFSKTLTVGIRCARDAGKNP